MTLSDSRSITDELLSAYIDDEVTEQERALVEAALVADEEVAWRLNSLRQTVSILHDLPELALPRSFILTLDQAQMAQSPQPQTEEQLASVPVMEPQPAMALMVPAMARPKATPPALTAKAGFWEQLAQGWHNFWQAGNPLLRNVAAASFALMLLLLGGGELLGSRSSHSSAMVA